MIDKERDLKRNASGYYDPTAYEAIKRADVFYDEKNKCKLEKLKKFRKEKIRLLKDFGITLTSEQKKRMNSFDREEDIDNFAHDLIFEHLGDD